MSNDEKKHHDATATALAPAARRVSRATALAPASGRVSRALARQLPPAARHMLLSAFAFSVMTLFVKLACRRLPTQEVVSARAVLTLVFSYAAVRRAKVPPLGSRRPLLWLRGTSGFAALSCVYYAVSHLPLAEATVLQYLHPPLTAVMAAWFLRERLDRPVLISLALGLVGVVLVSQPRALFGGSGVPLPPLAVAAAVGGAALSSCAYIMVRKLGATEHPLVIVLYFPLVSMPASLPALFQTAVWPRGLEWVWLLLVGVSTQVGQVSITRALALGAAGRTSVYSYAQVPLAALWGALFFGAWPNVYSLLGALLILFGAVLNVRAHAQARLEPSAVHAVGVAEDASSAHATADTLLADAVVTDDCPDL